MVWSTLKYLLHTKNFYEESNNNSQMCEKVPHISDVRDTCVPQRQEPQRQQQRIAEVRHESRETHEKRVQLQRNETQNYDQMCKKSGDCGLTVPITEKS